MEENFYTKFLENRDSYVRKSKERTEKQAQETRLNILEDKKIWGPGESIRDHEKECFLNGTNSVILKEDELMTDFFTDEARKDEMREKFASRGANYFVSLNPLRDTAEKIDIIKNDISDILEGFEKRGVGWKEKTAMFDYVKQHALTLYHALQYPRRFGINLSKTYLESIERAEKAAIKNVKNFYLHLLGFEVDLKSSEDLLFIADKLKNFSVNSNHFKVSELDNPLVIMGNAYANSVKYPETENIIALPSGGTQPGIATQMFMELSGGSPKINFVPLSTHSAKKQNGEELSSDQLSQMIKEIDVKDRKVLIAEDNSNSGNTIVRITDTVKNFSPASLNVSLAELDPWRVFVKSKFGNLEVTNE